MHLVGFRCKATGGGLGASPKKPTTFFCEYMLFCHGFQKGVAILTFIEKPGHL